MNLIFASLASVFLILSSCAKKSSSVSSRVGSAARGTTIGANTVSTLGISRCTDGSSTWGRIYNDGSMFGSGFRDAFADYLSASPGSAIGELDGSSSSTTTGVDMELKLKIVNNQLNLSESRFTMEIRDSEVGRLGEDGKPIETILIGYAGAKSGQVSNVNGGSGNFNITFEDQYGIVVVEGSFNGTEARGSVKYLNGATAISGVAGLKSLGIFYMKSCGLFF